jgi:hypothetical protein
MKMTILYLTIAMLSFSNCNHSASNKADTLPYKEIVLENFYRDTCLVFKDQAGDTINFNRNFELLENTCGDTLNIGFNYVEPYQKGKYFTGRVDTLTNTALDNSDEFKEYIESIDSPELYTKYLCIYNLSMRHGHTPGRPGRLRLRVYYKPKKVNAN